METLHQRADRPAFVTDADGWRVYISVHDQAYLREYAAWRQRVVSSHPDKPGGSHAKFVHVRAAFDRWRDSEEAWYAQYQHPVTHSALRPPTLKAPRDLALPTHVGFRQKSTQRILAVLQDGLPHTKADIEVRAGRQWTTGAWSGALHNLRARGAQFAVERRDGGTTWYRLLAPATIPHATQLPTRIADALQARPYTSQELADTTGAGRDSINRVISQLRKRGLSIATSRRDDGVREYRLEVS